MASEVSIKRDAAVEPVVVAVPDWVFAAVAVPAIIALVLADLVAVEVVSLLSNPPKLMAKVDGARSSTNTRLMQDTIM